MVQSKGIHPNFFSSKGTVLRAEKCLRLLKFFLMLQISKLGYYYFVTCPRSYGQGVGRTPSCDSQIAMLHHAAHPERCEGCLRVFYVAGPQSRRPHSQSVQLATNRMIFFKVFA